MTTKDYQQTDDDDRVVPDGGVVRVPIMLMDALQRAVSGQHSVFDAEAVVDVRDPAGNVVVRLPWGTLHRPGCRPPVQAIRDRMEAVHQTHVAVLSDAWRSQPVDRTPVADAAAARDGAYAAHEAYLRDAWRTR